MLSDTKGWCVVLTFPAVSHIPSVKASCSAKTILHMYKREYRAFPGGPVVKNTPCNAGHLGSIPGLGRSPGEGKGYSLQYSGLENSVDCVVYRVTESWTQLSDFHFLKENNFFSPLDGGGDININTPTK